MEEENNAFRRDADIIKLLDNFELYPNPGVVFPKEEDVDESEIWTVLPVSENLPEGVGARFLLKSSEVNLELDFSAGSSTMRWDAHVPDSLKFRKPVKEFLDETQKLLFFELPARIDPLIGRDEKFEVERMKGEGTRIDLITQGGQEGYSQLSENANYMQFVTDFCSPQFSYEYLVAHIAPYKGGRPLYTLTVRYAEAEKMDVCN